MVKSNGADGTASKFFFLSLLRNTHIKKKDKIRKYIHILLSHNAINERKNKKENKETKSTKKEDVEKFAATDSCFYYPKSACFSCNIIILL